MYFFCGNFIENTENIEGEVTLKVKLAACGDIQVDHLVNMDSPAPGQQK